MKTEIYESDAFSPKRGPLIASLSTEYRFERGDEVFFDTEPERFKARIIGVQIHVRANGDIYRDVLALRL
jgi:hypothetical protein